jgi:hypothetical protein
LGLTYALSVLLMPAYGAARHPRTRLLSRNGLRIVAYLGLRVSRREFG